MKSHTTRFLSLALALVLSVSLCVPAFAAEADSFTDVENTAWYYSDVTECAALGIAAGYEDGSFLPDDNVTSIQFLTMLTRTFYASELDQITVPAGQPWYYPNTKAATDIGLSKNLADADINDTTGMTRYNMAVVLYNTLIANNKNISATKQHEASKSITDYNSIPTTYRTPVANCYAQGVITGMSDGSFSGEQSMTRAQACAVIMRMLKLINNDTPGDKDNDVYDDGTSQNPSTDTTTDTTTSNGTLANGQPATPENVTAMLDQIKIKYPDGTTWGTQNGLYKTPSKAVIQAYGLIKCNADTTSACGGFAAMVSDTIFGNNTGTEVTNMANVRPGDIVVKYKSNGVPAHVAIVLSALAPGTTGNANTDRWQICCASGNMSGGYVLWNHYYGVMGIGANNPVPATGTYYRFVTRY